MARKLYLDDCANSDLLATLLQQAGHFVVRPADVQLGGKDDHVHFAYAMANGLAIVTQDPADFLALHGTHPGHPGILAIYQDNDLTRDMTEADIVRAIANLEAAAASGGDPIEGHFHNLNRWRY